MSLPSRAEAWADEEYAEKYGEKKLMSELMEYEKITGKNWADALMALDSVSHSIEKFHKEVVLPLIRQTRSVTGSNDSKKCKLLPKYATDFALHNMKALYNTASR